MTLAPLLSRARYLTIGLPLFALGSTIHAGCTSGASYYNGRYGGNYRTASGTDAPASCIVYRTRSDESGSDGYFGPCSDDDGYGAGYGDGYGAYGGHGR
jgi:hypothetical protein